MRLTIAEYAKHFKMSKEMIQTKLKTKKLNYIIEDGIAYIIVPQSSVDLELSQEIVSEKQNVPAVQKVKPTVATVLGLYQRENQHLKNKILELEAKIDRLINDKEQMLRDERDKIEQLYTAKDEQLKNILELINKKMTLENQTVHDVTCHEVIEAKAPKLVELKEYLKTLDLDSNQRKEIKKHFINVLGSDVRVVEQNGKMYLDFEKYDYTDLFKC